MKLQLHPVFTCISTARKPKLYVAMFYASLHLLLELNEASGFCRKKINMRIKLVALSLVQIK